MPKKNVLAILSGGIAIVLAVVSALTHGEPLPVLGATVAAIAMIVWGVKIPSRRTPLVTIAAAVGSGFLFLHFDNFWGLFVAVFVIIWAAFGLLPVMDGGWRLKLGFVVAGFFGALVALWPTVDSFLPAPNSPVAGELAALGPIGKAAHAIGTRLHCPTYLKDNVGFAIAPGAACAIVVFVLTVLLGGGIPGAIFTAAWHGAAVFGLTGLTGTVAGGRRSRS